MRAASRRGALLGVVGVMAVIAWAGWFVLQDEATTSDVDVIASTGDEDGEPPVFKAPDPGGSDPEPVPVDIPTVVIVDARPSAGPETWPGAGPVVARGNVSWPENFGVTSVEVILYDSDGFELDLVDTDAEGRYELRYDEPLIEGWGVGTEAQIVDFSNQVTYLLPAMCGELSVLVPGEPPVECDLLLGFAPTIAGRVTSRADGLPIEYAEVYAASTLRPWATDEIRTETAEDGTYLLSMEDLPTQDVILWFLADDHQAQLVGPMNLEPTSVPGELVHVNAALDAPSMIRGHVLDAASGLPVDNTMVTVGSTYSVFTHSGDWDVTGDEGEFSLDSSELPPSGSWVLAVSDDYGPAVVFPDIPAGSYEIFLGPIQTVSGLVLDAASSEPIPDADIMIAFVGDTWELDHGLYDEEYSGEDGRFTIELGSVPVSGARVHVESDTHAPLDVPFESVATRISSTTWEVVLRLTSL